ncbi:MAG TPA: PAS domain-containing protein [Actinoplanes sp.]
MRDDTPPSAPWPLSSTVLTQAPVGIAVLDSQLRYRWLSEAMARYNGIPVKEHRGRTVGEVLPDIADDLLPHLKAMLITGTAVRDVEVATGPPPQRPGRSRLWRASYFPVPAAPGESSGVVVFAEDVTDQRDAELARSRTRTARNVSPRWPRRLRRPPTSTRSPTRYMTWPARP